MDKTKCYSCQQYGHIARDCPNDDAPKKSRRPSPKRGTRGNNASGRVDRTDPSKKGRGGHTDSEHGRARSTARGRGNARGRGSDAYSRGRGNERDQKEVHGKQRGRSTSKNRSRSPVKKATNARGRGKQRASSSDRGRGVTSAARGQGHRRTQSANDKKVTFAGKKDKDKDSADLHSDKKCYNCGNTGHVSRNCTNEKSVRDKGLPWPQHRRLKISISTLTNYQGTITIIKDWTKDELASAKEYLRLCECLIDAKVMAVRIAKEIELIDVADTKNFTFWSRCGNTKTEISTKIVQNDKEENIVRLACWQAEAAKCIEMINNQQITMLNLVETTGVLLQQVIQKDWHSASIQAIMAKRNAHTAEMNHVALESRVSTTVTWLAAVCTEMHLVTKDAVIEEADRIMKKHSDKQAMEAVNKVAKAARPATVADVTVEQVKQLELERQRKRAAMLAGLREALKPMEI